MLKNNSSILVGCKSVILILVIVMAGFFESAWCQTEDIVLLLQQAPAEGGKITPSVGVHSFDLNTEVTLTAIPKPGYQFVCWLGDVSDAAANSTVIYLDSPKIVIAVFERAEYEFFVEVEEKPQSMGGGGGLSTSRGDYSRQGFGGPGAKRPRKWRWPEQPTPEPPEPEDFPVPEEGEDFPVPIPEPATGVLLVLGGLFNFVLRRSRNKPYRKQIAGKTKN